MPTRSERVSSCSGGIFDWDQALLRLDELNSLSEDPKLWDNPEKAQALMRERNKLAAAVEKQRSLERGLDDAVGLAEAFWPPGK